MRRAVVAWIFATATVGACVDLSNATGPDVSDAGPDGTPTVPTATTTTAGDASSAIDASDASDASDAGPGCPVSYVAGPDGGCTFVDPIKDPSFQGTPPGAWTLGNGAKIYPTANGPSDLGIVTLQDRSSTPAQMYGTVSQVITLPSRADSEPLALDIAYRMNGGSGGLAFSSYAGALSMFDEVGGNDGVLLRRHACLGEAAYGATYPLMLAVREQNVTQVDIDSVTISPDPTCPSPGTVVNGDFEAAGGWTVTTGAVIVGGIGSSGSRAAHLVVSDAGGQASSVTGTVSVPGVATKGAALAFHTSGSGDVTVLLDGAPVAHLLVSGDTDRKVCFPNWSRGLAMSVAFQTGVETASFSRPSGMDIVVDDVAVSSSVACDDLPDLQNGGFEVPDGGGLTGWYAVGSDVAATVKHSTKAPKSGTTALAMIIGCGAPSNDSPEAYVEQMTIVPAWSVDAGGPAVTMFYKLAAPQGYAFARAGDGSFEFASTAAWTKAIMCVPADPASTRLPLFFDLRGGSNGGPQTLPDGGCPSVELDIDDVAVTNDTSCPLER